MARLVSRPTLALALLVFLLPFLSVSCDTPDGFGRTGTDPIGAYSTHVARPH